MANRLRTLLGRESEGEITMVETAELDGYERLEHLMVMIKSGNLQHLTGAQGFVTYVPAALRREVVERAGNRCEYCRLPAEVAFYPHEVDHVIAEKHGGTSDIDNLAFACWRCNRQKGSELTSFDPETALLSPLLNPRTQVWAEHFAYEGKGLSA
jgi:5-methylcytosine-specific restriction endonuclease McrA